MLPRDLGELVDQHATQSADTSRSDAYEEGYRAGYVAALAGAPDPELEQAAREQLAGGVR